MFAVFFMSESLRPGGVEDQTIHVFEDETAAEDFVYSKLVEAGSITEKESGSCFAGGETCQTKAEAIASVQDGFAGLEFFHIYPAHDHRTAVPVA